MPREWSFSYINCLGLTGVRVVWPQGMASPHARDPSPLFQAVWFVTIDPGQIGHDPQFPVQRPNAIDYPDLVNQRPERQTSQRIPRSILPYDSWRC